jgi:NIMA (never in mitosis gene a)-related kinase
MESLSTRERQNALNEVRILASIDHPNIVAYKEAFTYQDKYLCIVMEYANDGDLYQKISQCQKSKTYLDEAIVW